MAGWKISFHLKGRCHGNVGPSRWLCVRNPFRNAPCKSTEGVQRGAKRGSLSKRVLFFVGYMGPSNSSSCTSQRGSIDFEAPLFCHPTHNAFLAREQKDSSWPPFPDGRRMCRKGLLVCPTKRVTPPQMCRHQVSLEQKLGSPRSACCASGLPLEETHKLAHIAPRPG